MAFDGLAMLTHGMASSPQDVGGATINILVEDDSYVTEDASA